MFQPTTATTNRRQTAKRKKICFLVGLKNSCSRFPRSAHFGEGGLFCLFFFSVVLLLTFFFLATSMVSKCYLEFQKYSDSVQSEFTVVT